MFASLKILNMQKLICTINNTIVIKADINIPLSSTTYLTKVFFHPSSMSYASYAEPENLHLLTGNVHFLEEKWKATGWKKIGKKVVKYKRTHNC